MGIALQNFTKDESLSGIWEINESEDALLKLCKLTEYDKILINDSGSKQRRIELLAVRALLHTLNPEITIQYDNRKPICNKGYISISHSDKYAAIVWHPEKQPTLDIEHINDRILRIAKRAFNDDELEFANDNTQSLTTIWSCK
ncbi:MAG: hypothetical protein C0596_10110 [Marinilabiliales bacterium]|nr:MAG: hypothetical protein C0596_10110 [Marinilabiliales bacterium]